MAVAPPNTPKQKKMPDKRNFRLPIGHKHYELKQGLFITSQPLSCPCNPQFCLIRQKG